MIMLRNLKALAVLAVAACTLTAVASASAVERFHSEGSSTTLTGTQIGTDVFSTDGGTVECDDATYKGTLSASTATTVTVAPTYSKCTALSGFASATIHTNGCEYKFNEPSSGLVGWMDIVCPIGGEITVTASSFGTLKCTIRILPQTGLAFVSYSNSGTGATREVTVTAGISGIKYTEIAGTGFGACSHNSNTNGSYEGETKVTGEHGSPATHTGIWVQ
jgi:hypothetical protein